MGKHSNIFGRNTSSNSLNNDQSRRRGADWVSVTPRLPCELCGRDKFCSISRDRRLIICYGDGPRDHPEYRAGRRARTDRNGYEYRVYCSRTMSRAGTPGYTRQDPNRDADRLPADRPDCSGLTRELVAQLTDERAAALAVDLGIRWCREFAAVCRRLCVGYIPGVGRKAAAWTFRERDGRGETVGFSLRTADGGKYMVRGTHRGLLYADDWKDRAVAAGYLLVVEGASDVAAHEFAGQPVVGRPGCRAGVEDIAELIISADLPPTVVVYLVGENDWKDDGRCPGRHGANVSADRLQGLLRSRGSAVRVYWGMVPKDGKAPAGHKDSRDYYRAHAGATAGPRRWATVGRRLAEHVATAAFPGDGSDLRELVDFLAAEFRIAPCPKPYHLQLTGKPHTKAAGVRCAVCARCNGWGCPACGDWKAANILREIAECLITRFADPNSRDPGNGSEGISGAWVGDPGNLYDVGRWGLYAEFPTCGEFQWRRQSINAKKGEYVHGRTTATEDSLRTSAGLNLRVKPSSDPSQPLYSVFRRWSKTQVLARGTADTGNETEQPLQHILLYVLPVDREPGRDAIPVSPSEWLMLLAAGLREIQQPTDDADQDASGTDADTPVRIRPIDRTDGFRMPDPEPVGDWNGDGQSVHPSVVKQAGDRLGISVPVIVNGDAIQGPAAGVVAPGIMDFVFGELIRRKPESDGPEQTATGIVMTYRRWQQVLTPDMRAGDELRHLIMLYLWSGPPPHIHDHLVEAIEADRLAEQQAAERRVRNEAAMAEVREIVDSLKEQYADRMHEAPELVRELIADPPKLRPNPRRRARVAPRWRGNNQTKSKKWLKVKATIGGFAAAKKGGKR